MDMSVIDKVNSSTKIPEELYRFVYISRMSSICLMNTKALRNIVEVSMRNNKLNQITGVLCYGNGYFFQYVEGSEQALTNLKNELLLDGRHQDISILDFSLIVKRKFEHWFMQSITLERWLVSDPHVKSLLPFKPYRWQGEEWKDFLSVLYGYYDMQVKNGQNDMEEQPANGLMRIIGEHQAFFVVQVALVILMLMAFTWCMVIH